MNRFHAFGLVRTLLLATLSVALPSVVLAQSVAGTVRDSSGAVLPGVTVEAASSALIERARSVVTDGGGQYQIIDLRPGTYVVTFTLPGFTTVSRTGLEVSGGGVITVNAEMRVSAVQETITVTGESPVVDVQTSTSREQVLSNEFVRALPAARGYGNYLAGVPGISGTGLSSGAATSNNFFTSRGGRSSEGNIQIDGMNVGSSVGGGGVSGYQYDMSTASEVQVTIAGGLAEVDRGGPAFNMVPKSGGNTFSGFYFASLAGEWGQGSNLDDELRAFGFSELPGLIRSWDTNFAFSGPIRRDRVWFFANARTIGTYQDTPGVYANANAGNPSMWAYAKDDSIKMRNANSKKIGAARLTWQATQRDKLGLYVDYTKNCSGSAFSSDGGQCRGPGDGWTASGPGIGPGVPTSSPESGTIWDAPAKIMQATYSAPWSNRVLVEAGFSSFWTEWGDIRPAGSAVDQIPVTEQTASATTGTPNSNFIYHGWPATGGTQQQNAQYRAAFSYVTGAHSFKVGYQGAYMIAKTPTFVGQQISYRFNNGVPNQLTQRLGPTLTSNRTVPDAFYVQDQWTRARLTLQGGLRYEHVRSFFPEGQGVVEAHRFGPAFTFPKTEGVRGLNDITPRMGASYDVFGTGKTAVKVSMSKYLQAAFNGDVYTINNPAVTLQSTTARGWTDANRDFVADCDFMNPAANGECQAWANLNWGQLVQTTSVNPDVQEGWGKRNSDWQFSAGVQHELVPRVSVDISYSRRWWGNFFATHNRALRPSDYDEVTLTAPADPRLPGGGGYPVSFLVRNNNSVLGVSDPVLHDQPGLRRRDALLARRGLHAQRPPDQQPAVPRRHQHGARRQRHLRRADRPFRPADDTDDCRRHDDDCRQSCDRRPTRLQRVRTVADHVPRAGVLHDPEGGRAGERDCPVAGQRAARRGRGHKRRLARGQLPDERGAVPGRHRSAAAPWRDDGNRQPAAAGATLRRTRQQHRHARREDRAHPGRARQRRLRLLQPDQRQHGDHRRSELLGGSCRAGRAVVAPDGGAEPAVRALQRNGGFLTTALNTDTEDWCGRMVRSGRAPAAPTRPSGHRSTPECDRRTRIVP